MKIIFDSETQKDRVLNILANENNDYCPENVGLIDMFDECCSPPKTCKECWTHAIEIEVSGEKRAEKPPLGLPSKSHWLAERMNDLCCAIQRYLIENHEIPKDWLEEMCWLTNVIREEDKK